MRVALINPPVREIVEREYDTPNYPNISIGYLAGYLQHKGLDLLVLDCKLGRVSLEEMLRRLAAYKPDVVGVTSMTHEFNQARLVAALVRRQHPGCRIVLGGIHVSALPEDSLTECPEADYLVLGEGEVALWEICEALENGGDPTHVAGIAYRGPNGDPRFTESRTWDQNLDAMPRPAWDLFPKAEMYPIVASRGCSFRCTFCMRALGNRFRFRSPESICDEMEWAIDSFGAKTIDFYDEIFATRSKHTDKVLDEMIRRNLGDRVQWYALGRVNWADRNLFTKLRRAGCYMIGFGVESGDEKILKIIKKDLTIAQTHKAVRMAKECGLKVVTFFILGHPYETKQTAKATIKLAVDLNPDQLAIGIMIPFPGTEIYDLAVRGEGGYKLLSRNWDDYNKQLGKSLELEGVSIRTLKFLQLLGFLKVYLYNYRFRDFFGTLFTYRGTATRILREILFTAGTHRRKGNLSEEDLKKLAEQAVPVH